MKRPSVWHNFAGDALATMRVAARARHPSRDVVDELIFRWLLGRRFRWLDVGIMGMVDYERLRPRLQFEFVGTDISENIVDDARKYIRGPEDQVLVWDVTDPPPSGVREFDLVTMRHVLNHCEYYEAPLEHVSRMLASSGRVMVILHLALVDGPDQLRKHEAWDVPGEVIGNRYGAKRFLEYFARHFVPELWIRVDDGHKPNDVLVGRARTSDEPRSAVPPMRRLWAPPGRSRTPLRVVSRAWLRWRTREWPPRTAPRGSIEAS